jgi:hypothetical protein
MCMGQCSVGMFISCNDSIDVTARMVGKQTGLARGKITQYLPRSLEKTLIIHSGDKKGYKLIETDQDRTKYSKEERDALEKWLLKDCDLVIKNQLKNDNIKKWDLKGNVVLGQDQQPLLIQKRLLMSSYCELYLYMIDNYRLQKNVD